MVCARGQLRSYFNALQPVKLGILTNGVIWEFFVDSGEPNIMDEEPFLTFDLEIVAMGGVPGELLQTLAEISKSRFELAVHCGGCPRPAREEALRTALAEELRSPSEEFCRFALQRVG